MKKLGKLTINPEKIIKNEELVNLRGGYDGYGDMCTFECNGETLGKPCSGDCIETTGPAGSQLRCVSNVGARYTIWSIDCYN